MRSSFSSFSSIRSEDVLEKEASTITTALLLDGASTKLYMNDVMNHREPIIDDDQRLLTFEDVKKVTSQIIIPGISVWLVFFVTIGIFPALVVHVKSQHKCHTTQRFYNDLFVPSLFVIINLFDFMGRIATALFPPLCTQFNIWIFALSRLVFFPLFLFCNIDATWLPVIFKNDLWPILFIILLALSNGYIASACMMFGPSMVRKRDAALAGTIMLVFLTAGIVCGSLISFLVIYIATGSF